MNAIVIHKRDTHSQPRATSRNGITLLEVLVACGILAVGLASVAALLPAAGSRLGQAAVEDRVAAAAANAYADIVNRGLISSDLFVSGSDACVFGNVLTRVPPLSVASGSAMQVAVTGVINTRIDADRTFSLEDELVYASGTTVNGLVNTFLNSNQGPRQYRNRVCWGAMLSPTITASSAALLAGAPATLSIAVFNKVSDPQLISGTSAIAPYSGTATLSNTNAGVTPMRLMTSPTAGLNDEGIRKQFLPACSSILVLPRPGAAATVRPQWVRITASWTNPDPAAPTDPTRRQSFIVLDDSNIPNFSSNYVIVNSSTWALSAVLFDGLMRVDQYPVTLD